MSADQIIQIVKFNDGQYSVKRDEDHLDIKTFPRTVRWWGYGYEKYTRGNLQECEEAIAFLKDAENPKIIKEIL